MSPHSIVQEAIQKIEAAGIWLWVDTAGIIRILDSTGVHVAEIALAMSTIDQLGPPAMQYLALRQNARPACLDAGHCVYWPNCEYFPVQPGICKERTNSKSEQESNSASKRGRRKVVA